MSKLPYEQLMKHYEACLEKFGDNHRGVDWPKEMDAHRRYEVMLGLIPPIDFRSPISILDFGCGTSHLYEHLLKTPQRSTHVTYVGVDISEKFIEVSKKKFPQNQYFSIDLMKEQIPVDGWDYCILNGVFTEKLGMTFDQMLDFTQEILKKIYQKTRKGLAFNVMSKVVDWERDDLFHLSFDQLSQFIKKELSRNFVIRQDYGLYEYTTYVYRKPFGED
jgi:SAM-dependent methyltransferase